MMSCLRFFFKYFRDITSFSSNMTIETETPQSKEVAQNPRNSSKAFSNQLEVSPSRKRNSFKDDQKFIKEYDKVSGFVSVNYKIRDSTMNRFSFGNNQQDDQAEEKWEKVNLKERSINLFIKSIKASEINIDVSFYCSIKF